MRLGIICPSEIAFRRFLPALKKSSRFDYVGLSKASKDEWFDPELSDETFSVIDEGNVNKANAMIQQYGGKLFDSYHEMIHSKQIDAIYIPLPPALHYRWAKEALENGLHVLIEKPSTTSLRDTEDLVRIAEKNHLALHENYMFIFHSQIDKINEVMDSEELGDIRLIRLDFGFPDRGKNDFRYDKKLGGGALLDCGGYVLKYADHLLGGDSIVSCAMLNYRKDREVDIYGSGTLTKDDRCVQFSFGMDNDYRCSIDIWGSNGTLRSNRILTAPDGFVPTYTISRNGVTEEFQMEADDAFCNSINHFYQCIVDEETRKKNYQTLLHQEKLVDDFMKKAGAIE
ncbi:MAG: Gfo/Idh/MocA family oxidoreductase [Erysipelotrichaceae bacterium]|nr:Gfo/Idh/MocA family oxidoreductase [Erysipelotrichaceae bacterium]